LAESTIWHANQVFPVANKRKKYEKSNSGPLPKIAKLSNFFSAVARFLYPLLYLFSPHHASAHISLKILKQLTSTFAKAYLFISAT
jgi:hypothetical protein